VPLPSCCHLQVLCVREAHSTIARKLETHREAFWRPQERPQAVERGIPAVIRPPEAYRDMRQAPRPSHLPASKIVR